MSRWSGFFWLLLGLLLPVTASVAQGLEAVTTAPNADGGQTYSLSIQVLFLMTALTLLPGALLMMTSFARIIIVLAILRQALARRARLPIKSWSVWRCS